MTINEKVPAGSKNGRHFCFAAMQRCRADILSARAYRAAAALGIDTVLTSGGAGSCRKGISQLAALLRLRDALDGPEVLLGSGVNAAVIDELRAALPGARAFHASCKTLLESGMTFRREGVPMGLPGLDEWHIQQTDADAVRAAKAAVMR